MTIDKDKLNSIFGGLSKGSTVAILTHQSPDPDCLGACAGFAVLLKEVYGLLSEIYHFGTISHPKNKSLRNVLHIQLADGNDLKIDKVSAIVVFGPDSPITVPLMS